MLCAAAPALKMSKPGTARARGDFARAIRAKVEEDTESPS
jgi:hypothetical protein